MSNSKHTILYIMKSVHIDGRSFIKDKKIGVTGKGDATLSSRISQLSNTKNVFGAECIAAWEIPNHDSRSALYYEGKLHRKLKSNMVLDNDGDHTEWFYDDDSTIVDIVTESARKWGLYPINLDTMESTMVKKPTTSKVTDSLVSVGEGLAMMATVIGTVAKLTSGRKRSGLSIFKSLIRSFSKF